MCRYAEGMDISTLTGIGLNENQARTYIALVKNGSLTPPKAAALLGFKRSTAYAVLDQLVEHGLASKKDTAKKLSYQAENPSGLESLARQKRTEALAHERTIQAAMPTLMNYFFTFNERPGVRFFQGSDEIREIYEDMLRVKKDVYVIRSPYDQDLLGADFYETFKQRKAALGITTHLINSQSKAGVWNTETDATTKTVRTQVPINAYDAKVETSIYGDKVAIISFGQEAIGMIIQSQQIADAQRQIFALALIGAQHGITAR